MTHAISAEGLALIQEHEGFRAQPASLPDGNWVVGHGHVRLDGPGKRVTRKQAAELLTADLAPIERLVNEKVAAPLTQSQFDALASFAFSVGPAAFTRSQVLRRVNAGEFTAAACAMDAWRKSEVSGALEVAGALVRRRAAEKSLFLRDLPCEPAPSVLLRAKIDHAAAILGAPEKHAAKAHDPGRRITEILNSEPATAAVLRAPAAPIEPELGEEIVTAHARPVARSIAVRRAPSASRLVEGAGHAALLAVGLALISAGAAFPLNGDGQALELAAAGVLGAAGAAVSVSAALGLRRAPHAEKPV